jgi:hypothetical protein
MIAIFIHTFVFYTFNLLNHKADPKMLYLIANLKCGKKLSIDEDFKKAWEGIKLSGIIMQLWFIFSHQISINL